MNRAYCEISMIKIQQPLDPWGYTIFFETQNDFRETIDEIANLTLYNTILNFLHIIDEISLRHISPMTLNG